MRELRKDTFSGNKNDAAHEHVERVLNIFILFNTLGVTHDAVMLRVFPITLTGAVKRWFGRILSGTINTLDLLKNAFIQRTSSSSLNGIAGITSKLDILGRDMKKLKENVHASQVSCGIYKGAHIDNDFPINEEVKEVKEVKYEEVGRTSLNNNGSRYRIGPSGYYIRFENRPPFRERRTSLKETVNKYLEESTRKQVEHDEWLKQFQENIKRNLKHPDDTIQTLDKKIGTLTKKVQTRVTGAEVSHCKASFINEGVPLFTPFEYSLEELAYFSSKSNDSDEEAQEAGEEEKSTREKNFVILDMVEDFRMLIILWRLLLATTHAEVDVFGKVISLEVVYVQESQEEIDYRWSMLDKEETWEIEIVEEPSRKRDIDLSSVVKLKVHWCMEILQQKGDGHEFWASCDPYDDQCDRGDLLDNTKKKYYWTCMNDDKRIDVAWEGMCFKD
uniref:Retrotransposon gag domain-containing protein n=1 Tax=Tanacetum cinerariifolium TaxID=118510 RepID=A0A6L2JYX5_TANCI|nr:hypothetical protein [Tanacetum cinerariifolium]